MSILTVQEQKNKLTLQNGGAQMQLNSYTVVKKYRLKNKIVATVTSILYIPVLRNRVQQCYVDFYSKNEVSFREETLSINEL